MQNATQPDVDRMQRLKDALMFLARLEEPYFLEATEQPPQSAVALLGQMRILVPMKGLIDVGAEKARVGRQIAKNRQDIERLEAQIGNPNFGKAPPHIQEGARNQLAQRRKDLDALEKQLERLGSLEAA